LRFFIDSLLRVRGLTPQEKNEIRTRVESLDIDDVIQNTSKMLSEITHYAGIVLAPVPARQRFRHIEFVPLKQEQFLCVLVTTEGLIENKLVSVDFPVDPVRLERIHNYLNELLLGLTLEEVRERVLGELGVEKNQYDEIVSAALRMGKAALDQTARSAEVIVTGKANLLDAAFGAARIGEDPLARMRDLMHALEEKELILRLLDRTLQGEGIQVFLGAESQYEPLGDASVVAMPYGPDEHPLGAIAVIGPMRMNYGKVMSVVDFTAELVSRLIAER
jgi:heat-inducible transcriptional repressor